VVGICSGEKRVVVPGQKRLPHALSDGQVRQLLGHVRNPIPRTCLATMYACGLRIGEATTLEIRSVDRANQVLRIIGKGDKERLVLLPQPVLDELGTLWRTHRNPRWLFPNGIVTLISRVQHGAGAVKPRRSCCALGACLLVPDFESARPDHTIGMGCKLVPTWTEVTVDARMSGEKVLRLFGRFEPLHLPLSSSRRSM
jgi:hypothetical protein